MDQVVQGYIRHALTAAAGALATDGVISGSEAQMGVAALMLLIGFGWSHLSKRLAKGS